MGVHLYTSGAWTDSGRIYRNSVNLFDKSKSQIGYQYNSQGEIEPLADYATSGYIPVLTGETYIRCYNNQSIGNYIVEYDNDLNFIRNYPTGIGQPITIPEGVSYVAFNIYLNEYSLDSYMFIQGQTPKPYEPYNVVDWYINNGHGYYSGAWI